MAESLCYPVAMIQRWAKPILLLIVGFAVVICAIAETYELVGGSKLSGEFVSANAQGLVVKREDGSFAPRVPWTNFTPNALKQLGQNPKARIFVEPFLDTEEDTPAKKAAAEITVKPVPRLDRPDRRPGMGAFFRSPLSIMLLIILYLANIYAGFEVAIFRNYPLPLVCSVSAVLPIAGPVLFLCLPTRLRGPKEELAPEGLAQEHQAEHVVAHDQETDETAPAPAHVEHSGPSLPAPIIYQRGHFSFNRRFFETKMSGFLRVVPSEAEKDMLIYVKSSRGDFVATRIVRLMPNEVYFHVVKAGASTDVMVPYTELAEVQVRHKDLH